MHWLLQEISELITGIKQEFAMYHTVLPYRFFWEIYE